MGMLADQVDHVVDAHRDAHCAAAVAAATGAIAAQSAFAANPIGYKRALRFARQHAREAEAKTPGRDQAARSATSPAGCSASSKTPDLPRPRPLSSPNEDPRHLLLTDIEASVSARSRSPSAGVTRPVGGHDGQERTL
jgi:hypothetical protein